MTGNLMAANLRVTVYDPENGETTTQEIKQGDYALITAEPAYLDGVAKYSNGTSVLTIKIRKGKS